jgi:hypothetical protein
MTESFKDLSERTGWIQRHPVLIKACQGYLLLAIALTLAWVLPGAAADYLSGGISGAKLLGQIALYIPLVTSGIYTVRKIGSYLDTEQSIINRMPSQLPQPTINGYTQRKTRPPCPISEGYRMATWQPSKTPHVPEAPGSWQSFIVYMETVSRRYF